MAFDSKKNECFIQAVPEEIRVIHFKNPDIILVLQACTLLVSLLRAAFLRAPYLLVESSFLCKETSKVVSEFLCLASPSLLAFPRLSLPHFFQFPYVFVLQSFTRGIEEGFEKVIYRKNDRPSSSSPGMPSHHKLSTFQQRKVKEKQTKNEVGE